MTAIPGGNGHRNSDSTSELLERAYEPVQERLDRVMATLHGLSRDQSPPVAELLDHVLATTGKRIRPALTLLASDFHPNDGRDAETIATSMELLHIAALLHDDTIDESDTRRGRTTVNEKWGSDMAVLLGDYILASAAKLASNIEDTRAIRRFASTAVELSSGELHERLEAYDWRVTRKQYLQRIYNKTASLFATACEAGSVLSGAPETIVQTLKEYGHNLGMAFQIVDDILDLDGTAEEVGKPVGSDLAQGTMTLPAIMAVERYPEENPIETLFQRRGDAESAVQVMELIQDSSIIEDSYAVAGEYCRRALDSLADLERSSSLDSLEDLVHYVLGRHA